jgi:ATP-dependent DNA helicase DinG
MVHSFRENIGSVLFGTDSFWTGVDVPGEALSHVIVTKIPFESPGNPLVEARIEDITARGGNAFRDYSLPEAVLKFRQGIGRLIRSRTDTGIVTILDSRVTSKFYGARFMHALPPAAPRNFI